MKLSRLTLGHFRNIESADIALNESFNLFVGPNGQGKTSILEAIAFLGDLRSFRSNRIPDLMRKNEISTRLCGYLEAWDSREQFWSTRLECQLSREESNDSRVYKRVKVNERVFGSSLAYLRHRNEVPAGGYHAIAFNPGDHEVVQGPPAVRRELFNRVFSSFSGGYIDVLKKYQRVLDQRNALLKDPRGRTEKAEFDDALVSYGSQLIESRYHFLRRLEGITREYLTKIAPQQAPFSMSIQSSLISSQNSEKTDLFVQKEEYFVGQNGAFSIDQIESRFREALLQKHRSEREAGVTLVGPHRDDYGFFLDEASLKSFGSQGEIRSVLLAMKLAEIQLYQECTGMKPLLLIDDFSSELDQLRRRRLVEELSSTGLQTFVTSTETLKDWGLEQTGGRVYSVAAGRVSAMDSL